jgi:hypothetical protein
LYVYTEYFCFQPLPPWTPSVSPADFYLPAPAAWGGWE